MDGACSTHGKDDTCTSLHTSGRETLKWN